MRVLVTGTEGQIAHAVVERAAERPDVDLIAVGRPELDLADPPTVDRTIAAYAPDLVVNAAAYTDVDRAEDNEDTAHAVNAVGAAAVAAAAARARAPVVQISTDYVFDGRADLPYREDDPVHPLGAYGRTKLAGERGVAQANPRHVIIRTAWVFGPYGRNFLTTMLRLAQDRDEIGVVADQIGNPTSAQTVADGLLAVVDRLGRQPEFSDWGVYHLAGRGDASWADLAGKIFELSRELGGPSAKVRPISTADFTTRAMRPANSRLDSSRFSAVFGFIPQPWQQEVAASLNAIHRGNGTRSAAVKKIEVTTHGL